MRVHGGGLRFAILLVLVGSALGIYNEGHWNYSKKLTSDNFKETIESEIEAGRTMFVRWIASAG